MIFLHLSLVVLYSGERPGMCPIILNDVDSVPGCVTQCEDDHDCLEMSHKCCYDGCGYTCQPPMPEGR